MILKRHRQIHLPLLLLGLLPFALLEPSCQKEGTDGQKPRRWPQDDYAPRDTSVDDNVRSQSVLGFTAAPKMPVEELKKKNALLAQELRVMESFDGELHIRFDVVYPVQPFVLELKNDQGRQFMHMGAAGTVHTFDSVPVTTRIWGPARIPPKTKITAVHLYLESRLNAPLRFVKRSNHKRTVRWPKTGGIRKFPLWLAFAYRLDNDQTLIRTTAVDKTGRQTSIHWYRIKTAAISPQTLRKLFTAACENKKPTGVEVFE